MSLETRRVGGDLIEVFKILNGGDNIDSDLFLNMIKGIKEDIIIKKLLKIRSWLDIEKYVFEYGIIDK